MIRTTAQALVLVLALLLLIAEVQRRADVALAHEENDQVTQVGVRHVEYADLEQIPVGWMK